MDEDVWLDWHESGCCAPEADPFSWRFSLIPVHQIRSWARQHHYESFLREEHEADLVRSGLSPTKADEWVSRLLEQTAPECWCGYFEEMFNFACNLCGSRREVDRLVVDHDHNTGMVRGFLCRGCNTSEPHHGGVFSKWRKYPTAVIYRFPPMKYMGFGHFTCPDNVDYSQTFLGDDGSWHIPY